MPANTINRRASRRVRKSAHARKNKQKPGRAACAESPAPAPAIIANSLFALTLKSRSGVEVAGMVGKEERAGDDDFAKMYKDLRACLLNAFKILGVKEKFSDPLREGKGLGPALCYLTDQFKRLVLPDGFHFSIDRDEYDEEYYFTVFAAVDAPDYWQAFELKPVVEFLAQTNKPLHDFFIVLVKSLIEHLDIYTWYNGFMGNADYWLEEEIFRWEEIFEGSMSEEDIVKHKLHAEQTLAAYKSGIAKRYETLLENTNVRTTRSLERSLCRFYDKDKKNAIINWMFDAILFMDKPGSLDDFVYPEYIAEMHGGEGLEIHQQVTLIWDSSDEYTSKQEESIDDEAQGCGIIPPLLNISVTRKNKTLDFKRLESLALWPMRLNALWKSYTDMVKTIKPVKKRRNEPQNKLVDILV